MKLVRIRRAEKRSFPEAETSVPEAEASRPSSFSSFATPKGRELLRGGTRSERLASCRLPRFPAGELELA